MTFQSTHPCGVRPDDRFKCVFEFEFQSTHPCGVRRDMQSMVISRAEFQSTHPCGVRLAGGCFKNIFNNISIHAPMWGATGMGYGQFWRSRFQSTHPCGVRPFETQKKPCNSYFNPRTHVGCDNIIIFISKFLHISIHAPMWGATVLQPFGSKPI